MTLPIRPSRFYGRRSARFGALSVHVLTRFWKLPAILRRGLPGTTLRWALAGASLATGAVLATMTLPAADRLQDNASAFVGVDRG